MIAAAPRLSERPGVAGMVQGDARQRMERSPAMSRRNTAVLALGLALCLLVTACGGEPQEEEAALPAGAPLGLSTAPVLVVGERPNDPDHELYRVVTPFLLPDGGLGVPLAEEGVIRVFDRQGELVRSLGSSGRGPGEFVALTAAWARGDTVEAFDGELRRVTRFVPGEAPETIALEGVASAQSAVPGLANGTWVLYGVKEVQRSGRDLIAVHRFAPDGSHVAELGELYGFRRHVHDMGGGPDPISPRPLVRTGGDRVHVAETLTPRITVFDVAARQTRSLEWEPSTALGHDEAVAVARQQMSTPGGAPAGEAWTLASFDALTGDEDVPVFWDFLPDGAELVWVRDYDPGVHATSVGGLSSAGPGGDWSVLDLEGRRVTTVTVPDDLEPLGIEADRLIGIRRDELDVESVRVYRIERSGS